MSARKISKKILFESYDYKRDPKYGIGDSKKF